MFVNLAHEGPGKIFRGENTYSQAILVPKRVKTARTNCWAADTECSSILLITRCVFGVRCAASGADCEGLWEINLRQKKSRFIWRNWIEK